MRCRRKRHIPTLESNCSVAFSHAPILKHVHVRVPHGRHDVRDGDLGKASRAVLPRTARLLHLGYRLNVFYPLATHAAVCCTQSTTCPRVQGSLRGERRGDRVLTAKSVTPRAQSLNKPSLISSHYDLSPNVMPKSPAAIAYSVSSSTSICWFCTPPISNKCARDASISYHRGDIPFSRQRKSLNRRFFRDPIRSETSHWPSLPTDRILRHVLQFYQMFRSTWINEATQITIHLPSHNPDQTWLFPEPPRSGEEGGCPVVKGWAAIG